MKLKRLMEDNLVGVIAAVLLGCIIMLIYSADRNTKKSSHISRCKCKDWLFDGDNKSGVFFKCKHCGRSKYIPYKELMGMPEKEYNYWTTRLPTEEEKYRQHKSSEK